MNKLSHTPGPWSPHYYDNLNPVDLYSEELDNSWRSWSHNISGFGGRIIGQVSASTSKLGWPSVDNVEEMKANLDLMCAAPEMLKVLKTLSGYLIAGYETEGPCLKLNDLEEIKRVIAKATGKESE